MPKLVLFDIDGTLVLTGGAGLRAMNRAFRDHRLGHGCDALARRDSGRRTHRLEHPARHARAPRARARRRPARPLARPLRDAPARRDPAARQRVQRDAARRRRSARRAATAEDVYLALLTGNFERGRAHQARAVRSLALLPVRRVWRRCGGSQRAGAGRRRARTACGMPAFAPDVLVVGDTPHDVACAQAVGAVPSASRPAATRRISCGTAAPDRVRDAAGHRGGS